jgi:hypothetical protein
MINTVFLENEDEYSKTFSRLNVSEKTFKFLNYNQKKVLLKNIGDVARNIGTFYFSEGFYELSETNKIYHLEHIPYNTDLYLPKYPKFLDWVAMYYNQDIVIHKVSNDRITKIKIFGNGNRVMGLDESLLCDMAFMSLRLCFMGPIDGWVVC